MAAPNLGRLVVIFLRNGGSTTNEVPSFVIDAIRLRHGDAYHLLVYTVEEDAAADYMHKHAYDVYFDASSIPAWFLRDILLKYVDTTEAEMFSFGTSDQSITYFTWQDEESFFLHA